MTKGWDPAGATSEPSLLTCPWGWGHTGSSGGAGRWREALRSSGSPQPRYDSCLPSQDGHSWVSPQTALTTGDDCRDCPHTRASSESGGSAQPHCGICHTSTLAPSPTVSTSPGSVQEKSGVRRGLQG